MRRLAGVLLYCLYLSVHTASHAPSQHCPQHSAMALWNVPKHEAVLLLWVVAGCVLCQVLDGEDNWRRKVTALRQLQDHLVAGQKLGPTEGRDLVPFMVRS